MNDSVRDKYLYMLVLISGAERVLEIGVQAGASTIVIAKALKNGSGGSMVGVDNWSHTKHLPEFGTVDGPRVANERLKACGLDDRVNLVTADSQKYMQACKPGDFDFVHVDGNHKYRPQLADIQQAWRIASKGIAVHDAIYMPQVTRAVKDSGLKGVMVPVHNGYFIATKKLMG